MKFKIGDKVLLETEFNDVKPGTVGTVKEVALCGGEEYYVLDILKDWAVHEGYLDKLTEMSCDRFETTDIWVETNDGKRLTEPMYKGIDCETMYQHYMRTSKIKDLKETIENQRTQLKNLQWKYDELKKLLVRIDNDISYTFKKRLPF